MRGTIAARSLPRAIPSRSPDGTGAATNNLPVDVMRNMHRGRIIAVDVAQDRAVGPEVLEAARKASWLSRLMRPPIVSILIRSATVTGVSSALKSGRTPARKYPSVIRPAW